MFVSFVRVSCVASVRVALRFTNFFVFGSRSFFVFVCCLRRTVVFVTVLLMEHVETKKLQVLEAVAARETPLAFRQVGSHPQTPEDVLVCSQGAVSFSFGLDMLHVYGSDGAFHSKNQMKNWLLHSPVCLEVHSDEDGDEVCFVILCPGDQEVICGQDTRAVDLGEGALTPLEEF